MLRGSLLGCVLLSLSSVGPTGAVQSQPAKQPKLLNTQAIANAQGHNRAGHTASNAGDHAKALEEHTLAWAAAKPFVEGTGRNAAVLLEAIGASYVDLKQDIEAEPFLKAALVEYQAARPVDPSQLAITLDRLASLSRRLGNQGQASHWRRAEIVQRRLLANQIQANPNSTPTQRNTAWLELVSAVAWLSETGGTIESFDHIEAALAALEPDPSAAETYVDITLVAIMIIAILDPERANSLVNSGLASAQNLPLGDGRSRRLGNLVQQQASIMVSSGRVIQAEALYQLALEHAQATSEGAQRNELVRSLLGSLATLSVSLRNSSKAISYYKQSLNLAPPSEERISILVGLAAAQVRTRSFEEARTTAEEANGLERLAPNPVLPYQIIRRMMLSEINADIGQADLSLSFYNTARSAADAIQLPIFSEYDVMYKSLGTKALLANDLAPRAYGDLSAAGKSLLEGPGRTFGVNIDSRRIFNEYRHIFQTQVRAGWLAANSHSAPAAEGSINAPR